MRTHRGWQGVKVPVLKTPDWEIMQIRLYFPAPVNDGTAYESGHVDEFGRQPQGGADICFN